MKKRRLMFYLTFLISMLVVAGLGIVNLLQLPQQATSIEIEVTLAKSVTQTVGNTQYTFKLYSYDQESVYILQVERANESKTLAVTKGHTYRFLDLEIYVKDLVPGGIRIRITHA